MSRPRLLTGLAGFLTALLLGVASASAEPASTGDAAADSSSPSAEPTLGATDRGEPAAKAAPTGEAPPPGPLECPTGSGLASGKPDPALFRSEPDVRIRATWCERYDAHGHSMRHGPYLDRYPSGKTRTRARYVEGEIQGAIRMWHENGRPWLAATYVDGELDGPYLMTQPNGNPWYEATYRHGLLEGPVRTWYPNGTLSGETPHKAGVEHGLARTFYPNGHPMTEIEIRDGVWNGVFRRWHPNGKLAIQGHYTPCEAGRKLPRSCPLLGAARDGEWKEWNAPGRLIAHDFYRRGERVASPTAPVAAPSPAPVAAPAAPADDRSRSPLAGEAVPPASATVDAPDPRGSLER